MRCPVLHSEQQSARRGLADYVDALQSSGRYTFTRDEVVAALGVSDDALRKAVARLAAKKRLAVPRRGFYAIVPLEYRDAGAPPPSWFIDDFMKAVRERYYVGLLTAAALHGAGHHQVQQFQVITGNQLRPVIVGRSEIRFFKKALAKRTPTTPMKTETGTMNVSTPEATALDLVRYVDAAGQLGSVVTAITELAEKIDAAKLADAAKKQDDLAGAQRLGHILELVGATAAATNLAEWVAAQRPRYIALAPHRSIRRAAKNARWHVVVNERLEPEA